MLLRLKPRKQYSTIMAIRDTDGHALTSAPPITLTNAANSKTQTIKIDCVDGYLLYGSSVAGLTVGARHGSSGGFTNIEVSPIDLAAWDGSTETFEIRFTGGAIAADARKAFQLSVVKGDPPGAYTMTAGAGSFALTGRSVTLNYTPAAPDYATPYIAALGTADATLIAAIQQLDDDFTAAGLWPKMHVVYPFAGGTASTCKWNMKDPQNTDAAHRATFSGSGESYTDGYTTGATGLSSCIDTHYIPNGNMVIGNGHTSICVKSTANDAGNDFGVVSTVSAQILVWCRYTDGKYYDGFQRGSSGTDVANPTSAAGRYIQSQTTTTAYASYKNGSSFTTSSANVAANGLPTHSIFIGGYNSTGTQTDRTFGRQYQFFTAGLGLTSGEAAALDAAIAAFNTALGR